MCRLLGMVANQNVDLSFSLLEADRAFKEQSESNPDGWGIAAWKDERWSVWKEARKASASQEFESRSREAKGRIIISHIRKATVGSISYLNTHPFQYKNWIFAHNGSMKNANRLKISSIFQPEGQTDSERIFYSILTRLIDSGSNLEASSPQIVSRAIAEVASDSLSIDKKGALNFMLSEGVRLYIHRHGRSLFSLVRDSNDPPIAASTQVLRLYEDKKARGERAILIATQELTESESWQAVSEDTVFMADPRDTQSGLIPLS